MAYSPADNMDVDIVVADMVAVDNFAADMVVALNIPAFADSYCLSDNHSSCKTADFPPVCYHSMDNSFSIPPDLLY